MPTKCPRSERRKASREARTVTACLPTLFERQRLDRSRNPNFLGDGRSGSSHAFMTTNDVYFVKRIVPAHYGI
jgi:hypothetical protein